MKKTPLSFLSTVDLIQRIVNHSNKKALNHLLSERKLFSYRGEKLLLSEYLYTLRKNNFAPYIVIADNEDRIDEKIDITYDRTLMKFSNLSLREEESTAGKGPYCNKQYVKFLEINHKWPKRDSISTELELEQESGRILQNLVINHIIFSWKEACRIVNPALHRYTWHLKNGNIDLMKPRSIPGRKFRNWLENNITNPNPNHKEEKQRIQKEVYNHFGMGYHFSFTEAERKDVTLAHYLDPIDEMESAYLQKNFYTAIADEKSENIKKLRPAIRYLGKDRVRELVLRILNHFTEINYSDKAIADEFGLLKPTFSRFAGRNWKKKSGNLTKLQVPDLWKNIARVITSNPHFTEAAITFGVKGTINTILPLPK